MTESFESVQWKACVHRLDLGLYSRPKELQNFQTALFAFVDIISAFSIKKTFFGHNLVLKCSQWRLSLMFTLY